MANNSPTIVAASLSDDQLKKSINSLVTHVDEAMKKMVQSTNNAVGEMESKLKSLGNIKMDSGGYANGGASKRTKAQNAETEAVEKNIAARGKQIKQNQETATSFDNIASATTKAARSASTFIQSERESLRMRQNEIQAKIDSLRKQFGNVEIKTIVRDDGTFSRAIDKAKQKIEEVRRQLQNVPPTSVLGKQFSQELQAARNEYNELIRSRKAFEAKSQITSLASEYEQNNKKLRELATAYKQLYTDEKQAENAMNNGAAAIARYGDSAEKAQQKLLKASFNRAINILPQGDDLAYAKLERLRSILADHRFLGALSPSEIKRARAEVQKLESQLVDYISKMNSSTQAQQQAANANSQQSRSIDEMNAYIRQNIQREQERREAIRQTGLAARETADQLIRSAHEQASAQGNSPITGTKELTVAVEQMRRAYFDMTATEKASPIGLALEADIKKANEAITVIRKYNQSLLGTEQRNNNNITNTSTLSGLRESLKNLTEQYSKLTIAEIRAGKGDELIQKYQKIGRAAHVLQKQLSTPISFNSINSFNARSLEDIAYKMQMLRSYKQSIDLTKPNAASEIRQVDEALAKLQKDADKWMSKSQQMIKSNTALGRSWNYMKNRLAFYFTVGASTQFIKNLIEVRSQYEMNERALGILINSAERGTQIFNELSQMALVSPYTLIELSSAAKQLTAYDVAARDVVDTTRRLADMAAAVGIPIERLTYALGQIKAYGYLNSRDARMFANAGIPLVKQLSDYYTELEGRLVSTADVYDRIKKKTIDYNEVMEVINKMTDRGGKFFDFQAKMADTLKVRLANLTLAWNNMLNDMGKESQGVLTWGIGALRDLFLQWKQLDNLIKDAALAVGVRTLLVALRAATIGLGSFGKAMTWNAILGKKLGGIVVGLAKSFGTLFSSRLTWFALLAMAAVEATQAILGVNEAQKALNESIRNGAKDNYDNISKFLEQYKEVRESLYSTQKVAIGSIYNPTTRKAEATSYAEQQVGQDIDKNEAKKAWEAVREQIELTVASSDKYIGSLLSISNISERVRQGFNLLDDIQVVNAALKELDDDTIKVSKDLSAWWNAWQAPDGLIGNLKDYQETLNDIVAKYGTLESFRENTFLGGKGSDDLNDYQTALERFRDDLQKTTDSILNFIELKGWSGDESKINQVFEQITQKLVLDNQLDPQKAFTLQTEVEEARSKAAKQALLQRINDEKAALKVSYNQDIEESLKKDIDEYKHWDDFNGRKKVEWERFTKWLKEQHISETTAMFRNMDEEDIKSLNFQEGKHAEWVTRMVTQYAKEHKMSYDEAFKYLKSWVRSANQWSIFIPLTISSKDKKSVYDQLVEYDKAVDEADAQIERLTTRINELNAKKKKSKEETQELADAEQELADAQKAKADAEAKGGHGKKEKKDKKAADKAAKQAETELQKALKDELSTIDKVRSIYKDLTKEGMSHANAVERATKGWDETVNVINKVLQKNGLQKLDLSKFAGIENPRELVNMLQSQLNTLLKRGAKPAEIKELQTKIQTLNVDAEKYDLSKITKGLKNKLGKLKDEYELAVELDANPEMGNMFTQMFGIDTTDFPRTIGDYMQRVQNEFDKARMNLNLGTSLNVFKANTEQWYDWGKAVGYSKEQVDDFKKSFDSSIAVAKKWAQDVVKQTQDLQYKLADNNGKIAIEEEKLAVLRKRLAQETNEEQKRLLDLQIQDQQNAIAKLKEELLQLLPTYQRLFGEVAEHSAWMTRKLAKDYKNMLVEGKNRGLNADNTYSVRDPISGQISRISKERMGKEIKNADKELQKTQSTIKKITEAFTKGEDGVVDWVHGVELVGEELSKLSNLVDVVGQIADAFSNPDEYNETAEAIHDISSSINGIATAAQGIGQFASGDYIGGAASILSGVFTTVSAWMDNSDKKISAQVKKSERAVKRLELAYVDLEHAISNAYGTAIIGAKRAAITNKELQLAELRRQLQLEQSRKSKKQDKERIIELQRQIKELEYDIKDATKELVNGLLGISSVGSAAEELVSSMIASFRKGEKFMDEYKQSFDDMIDNMIMKAIVGKVIGERLEKIFAEVEARAKERAENIAVSHNYVYDTPNWVDDYTKTAKEWHDYLLKQYESGNYTEKGKEQIKRALDRVNKIMEESESITPEDVRELESMRDGWEEDVRTELQMWMEAFGIKYGQDSTKELSALQQGIQGITEDTAGALESYMNIVSQRMFEQGSLIREIRDVVVGFDADVQTATQAQMLLQLQQSYAVQMAIQGILEGWNNPSGQAVRVELVS